MERAFPVHVTLRVISSIPSLRDTRIHKELRDALEAAARPEFEPLCHCLQEDHIHLGIDAASEDALGRGMQGLNTRIARRVNSRFGRRGRVFVERYHSRVLRTPTEAANAFRYVIENRRKHLAEREYDLPPDWIDPFSSGWTLGGTPRSWIARRGWRVATSNR